MATKTKRKPRQGFLKGMKPRRVPAIEDAADIYYERMMERTRLSKEEHEAKDNLIDKMKEHKVAVYTSPETGLVVQVTDSANVTVKKKKPEPESNGEAKEADE